MFFFKHLITSGALVEKLRQIQKTGIKLEDVPYRRENILLETHN